jgi:GalNAc-alpha-(1->4)-GalNAc-alpha-(1->3)-diNAcBac-PP-undecaprenol alpha-1,4-N-acetyl-D-galactosaminyltransferase
MRICLVITSLRCGGAERVAATLANEWQRAGHDISLVTLAPAESGFYELDARIEQRPLNVIGASSGLVTGISANLRRLRRLRQTIRTIGPGAIVSFIDCTNVLVLIATSGLGIPVVVSERTDPRIFSLAFGWAVLRRLTYRRASALVVQTQSVATWARDIVDPRRVAVVPNPIADACFPIGGNDTARRRARRVVALGRLSTEKGFDVLIEAFARAAMAHPDWSLVIAGEGPLDATLRQQASTTQSADRIVFAGLVRSPETLLRDSEILVMSSRFEGFPNALVEGMACGCCVVATDCPSGPAEIVRSGANGIVVPVDDVVTLAGALEALMSDDVERRRLGAAAAASAERFRADGIADQWIRLLKSVAADSAGCSLATDDRLPVASER